MVRTPHTYAVLEVSADAYREIRDKLVAAGYDQAVHGHDGGEVVDMHGIALQAVPRTVTRAQPDAQLGVL